MSSMTRTANTTEQTAAGCYAERYAEAQDLLKRIATRLAEHQKRQPAWRRPTRLEGLEQTGIRVGRTAGRRSQK